MKRIDNFNAGPSALPLSVLERVREELVDYQGTGMSVMEMSHRSAAYEAIHDAAEAKLRRLLNVPDDFRVLFLQGGASLQFAMLPMNFLGPDETALYVLTGVWSEKAAQEAVRFGHVVVDDQAKAEGYTDVPTQVMRPADVDLRYVHVTSNNTIYGTQWRELPVTDSPLVIDMSSDILSRPVDWTNVGVAYAGAQKNLGPSGVTVVFVRDSFLARANGDVPTMLGYPTHVKQRSLYNTPPTFAIYIMGLVLDWIEEQGGVEGIAARNREKAGLLYRVIDEYPDFYLGHAKERARSDVNVTFRLRDDELSARFLAEATKRDFVGVKGHRSVGGCRVSLYNAVSVESATRFATFMEDFVRAHR
ncbi:3-phosphoserine/phosphohydroxythreonine transaminase [Alicyclobacillus fastidiosus]|uniref:Phosphoserine aminotransferase n=1 Tax=Alicyclobacillus fastidiosus TaxID=392011 RepID=A0ABY6ZC94_9BACL|nr:3-phosphoserine/phosphohydroxythreonine transaminase [Alicyclobacillus fastidiosus]WAH40464.1 3-phosphoserine/phosphohydroxythreonine transaminase [Alicyclobacillus fastidiosus]GMA61867.1 phosphoserine aminotransferase [Alicyclobacillus fastidiosus]